jgi:hypothetical protein
MRRIKDITANEPAPGELWTSDEDNRLLLIMGNSTDENGDIWCADDATGEYVRAHTSSLTFKGERPLEETVLKCEEWSASGNSNASWWLGWYYENVSLTKSVWHYIAAIRMSPQTHSRAFNRLMGDAFSLVQNATMQEPYPDLLEEIEEFQQAREGVHYVKDIKWGDWREALQKANTTIHTPASA